MYFVNICPWKTVEFLYTNLNSLHLRQLCSKFGGNLPCGSVESFGYTGVDLKKKIIITSITQVNPWKRLYHGLHTCI